MNMTQEVLKQVLHYNPGTGVFTWQYRDRSFFKDLRSFTMWNTRFAGRVTGHEFKTNSGKCYIKLNIFGKRWYGHRLAYLYMVGVLPDEVDHDDGNGTNNKWSNLNHATRRDNCMNYKLNVNNKSGVAGISLCKSTQRWHSRIQIDRQQIFLGSFDDFFEAVCVRKTAENNHGFHPNHGSNRPL